MAPSSTSPLLSLPRELRDIILKHVVSDPVGLRYEYGTGRLVPASVRNSQRTTAVSLELDSTRASCNREEEEAAKEQAEKAAAKAEQNFWAVRRVNRQLRNETVYLPLASNAIVFDNLHLSTRGHISRPNFRKYFNRWDTEFSEEPASPRDDMVAKPIAARVRSFLMRTSPAQRARLRGVTVVEVRPLGHLAALYDVLDEFGVGGGFMGLTGVELRLVIVPSVIGTFDFERYFVTQMRRCLQSKWFNESRHHVRFELDEGFEGLEDWIKCEFPTQVNVQAQSILLAQVRVIKRLAKCLDGEEMQEGEWAGVEPLEIWRLEEED
ncbi:hypothetical protein IWZ00DRAFT_285631 [Phyllosticta capitalensis]|uniref:Uncharacterized protein n=1 Tax=Phyllosticta capitalensis TaxID=121624 RepID=A0ABR1YR06_9PEZI